MGEIRPAVGGVLFSETAAAAQSLKSAWTRSASTFRSIEVVLTESTLTVRPTALVGLLSSLLRLDLRHEIPVDRIRRVEERGTWAGYGKVQVTFGPEDRPQGVLLYLEKATEFAERLEGLVRDRTTAARKP